MSHVFIQLIPSNYRWGNTTPPGSGWGYLGSAQQEYAHKPAQH